MTTQARAFCGLPFMIGMTLGRLIISASKARTCRPTVTCTGSDCGPTLKVACGSVVLLVCSTVIAVPGVVADTLGKPGCCW